MVISLFNVVHIQMLATGQWQRDQVGSNKVRLLCFLRAQEVCETGDQNGKTSFLTHQDLLSTPMMY